MPKIKKTRTNRLVGTPTNQLITPPTDTVAAATRCDASAADETLDLSLTGLQDITATTEESFLDLTSYEPITPVADETLPLCLEIPKKTLSKDEETTRKRHRAAAAKWVPKLQRPYPTKAEINSAYNLKLLRHYTDPEKQKELNFIKPQVQRSARVDNLRKQFPLHLAMPPRLPETVDEMVEELQADAAAEYDLKRNKQITKSVEANKLAWKNFATTEIRRCQRSQDDRQAVVLSGLDDRELGLEYQNSTNNLPEWAKWQTGKFANEHRAEQRRLESQQRLMELLPPARLGFSTK